MSSFGWFSVENLSPGCVLKKLWITLYILAHIISLKNKSKCTSSLKITHTIPLTWFSCAFLKGLQILPHRGGCGTHQRTKLSEETDSLELPSLERITTFFNYKSHQRRELLLTTVLYRIFDLKQNRLISVQSHSDIRSRIRVFIY